MAPLNIEQRRLKILQTLAAALMLATVGAFLLDGDPPLNAVVRGVTFGGISFVLLSIFLLLYWK